MNQPFTATQETSWETAAPPYLVVMKAVGLSNQRWLEATANFKVRRAMLRRLCFTRSHSWLSKPTSSVFASKRSKAEVQRTVLRLNPARMCISETWLARSCGCLITDRKWIRVASKAQGSNSKQEVIAESPLNHKNRWWNEPKALRFTLTMVTLKNTVDNFLPTQIFPFCRYIFKKYIYIPMESLIVFSAKCPSLGHLKPNYIFFSNGRLM